MKKNLEYNYVIKHEESFKQELKEIYKYIAYHMEQMKVAEKFINMITSKTRILEIFPFAHKLLRKSKNFEYRKLVIKNYIFIYRISLKEKEIFILHIYNQKLNWKTRTPLNQYK